MRIFQTFIFTSVLLGSLSSVASPTILRVRGTLGSSSGLGIASGSKDLQIALYAASSGGSAIWTSPVQSATVLDTGRFEALVDASLGTPSLKSSIAAASGNLWMEIIVDVGAADGTTMDSPISAGNRFPVRGTAISISALSAEKIRNRDILATAPVAGQALMWVSTSSAWGPSSVTATGTGDLRGATSAAANGSLALFSGTTGKRIQGSLVSFPSPSSLTTPAKISTAGSTYVVGITAGALVLADSSSNLRGLTTNVSDAELNYLSSLTANVQTQLDARQNAVTVVNLLSGSTALTLTGVTTALIGNSATISVATASASNAGIVTSSDWNRFNNKQATLTGVSYQVMRIASVGGTMTGGTLALAQSGTVTGSLPAGNGGTGVTTATQFLNTYSPLTTKGDLAIMATGSAVRVPVGADGLVLTAVSTATAGVGWVTAPATAGAVAVGTIVAFGGATVPTGWLLCDGTSYLRATYANLFTAIGTVYGTASGTTFNVPDFRGRFLRGRDAAVGRDPDRASRTAMNTGGSTGDNIGSIQAADYTSHSHSISTWIHTTTAGSHYKSGADIGPFDGSQYTASAGGNETRPKNANVNYIIKY